ncbi:hypothetical protein [Kibdelosporangium phytohabitans]|uniref:Uncharacterized protein n=1 Tax=Kibdelosporangium phytohabitans TaxID=860235 RepID=A0A0N9I4J3_9PSEU|nr:hypothetical protein [Kibdelosporangium phytohabitans]ALG11001.1 hypothetical protein AOZ06_32625 [Kibdelosporangium phytohabitans]MBE1462221.1 hypothetical protein [Kibdelosporangium phytohabitans]
MGLFIAFEVIGIIGMVQGFGSALVTQVWGGNWALMRWALEWQPVAGIAVGVLGLLIASIGWSGQKRIKSSRR